MENVFERARHFIDNHKPLPDIEKELDKFLAGFHNMSQLEIRQVILITIGEARKSRRIGLFLPNDLITREEGFFLTAIDAMGGVIPMTRDHNMEEVSKIIDGPMNQIFAKELEEYFEKFKSEGKSGSNLKYNAHLESVKGTILNAAYNDRLHIK